MESLRIALCDDEAKERAQLRKALDRYAAGQALALEVLEYGNADELLQNYPRDADILLLDIYMSGLDGMEAARRIRTFDPEVCIIFITTMYQRAIDGYAVRAFGFIQKPVRYTDFAHELTCAINSVLRRRRDCALVTLFAGRDAYRVVVRDILWCEVKNHSLLVYTRNGRQEYRGSIHQLEQELGPQGFFRCHTSYLVNAQEIRQIKADALIMSDGSEVPISVRRRKEFLTKLSGYVGEQI